MEEEIDYDDPLYNNGEEESDEDEVTNRWSNVNADLEMDHVFLDDDQEEEELLPELFDPESVQMLKSDNCMLCMQKFSILSFSTANNCKRCGKAICDSCSRTRRRLSRMEKSKSRVCDECDTFLANYNFSKLYSQEIQQKKVKLEEITRKVEQSTEEVQERTDQLNQLKSKYQKILIDVEGKSAFRDKELNEKRQLLEQYREKNQ